MATKIGEKVEVEVKVKIIITKIVHVMWMEQVGKMDANTLNNKYLAEKTILLYFLLTVKILRCLNVD